MNGKSESQNRASMAVWPLEEEVLGVSYVRQIVDDGNYRKMACNEYFSISPGDLLSINCHSPRKHGNLWAIPVK